jgi:branched-chain amino acid transport system ATP-binding protein
VDSSKPQLELRDIDAAYGTMRALFSVSLVVPEGGVVALLGPHGAGKTTTLRIAAGLLAPTGGTVEIGGKDVTKLRPRPRAQLGICLVPEGRGIFPNLTVKENVLLHTYTRPRAARSEVEELAYRRFPVLGERRNQVAGTLSGGEQQCLP